MDRKKIVVVGGGPAGMMAAIRAGELHQEVTLIEKNPTLGKKLLLSGKGRCNLTNACDLDSFFKRFSGNGQFLRDAFKVFFNNNLMRFFEKNGLKLKTERQLRVFPVTNKADSVLEILKKELIRNKVNISYKSQLKDVVIQDNQIKGIFLTNAKLILKRDKNRALEGADKEYPLKYYPKSNTPAFKPGIIGGFIPADKLILATGGISYSFTGSTGEGIDLAKKLGHRIVPLRPGLVPLEVRQKYPALLEGLTLKNIRLKFSDGKREVISEIGELLFTRFGISGPLVLSLSGKILDWLKENNPVYVEIDLKPALAQDLLTARILREFKTNPKKSIKNILKNLLPQRLVDVFIEIAKIAPDKKIDQVTQEERNCLVSLLKGLRLDIVKSKPIEEAMITRGGVSLKDINPRTMESRLIKGLYFAGEMIDVDADTGGFNLQAAFSTGYLAGESAALN